MTGRPVRTPLASLPSTRSQRLVQVATICLLVAWLTAFVAFRHHGHLVYVTVVLGGLAIAGQVSSIALRVRQRRRDDRMAGTEKVASRDRLTCGG